MRPNHLLFKNNPVSLFSSFLARRKEVLSLSLVWIVMALLVDPRGEFPLNDDWMYAHSAMTFLTQGRFELFDWQAITVLGQVLWGALFAKFFGFSMTMLRISVLVLGLLGVWSTYGLLRASKTSNLLSFWGALTLATTPLYFGVANSFMTDVPFYALTVSSYFFLFRYFEKEKPLDLAGGILFACLAILFRQLALVIPCSFALAYLASKNFNKKGWFVAVLSGVIVFGVYAAYYWWVKKNIGIPFMYHQKTALFASFFKSAGTALFWKFILHLFVSLSSVLNYLGFFLFPLLILGVPVYWKKLLSVETGIVCAGLCFQVGLMLYVGLTTSAKVIMPSAPNYIYDFGFGPLTVYYGFERMPVAPITLWWVVTAIGVLGSGIILANFTLPLFRFIRTPFKERDPRDLWRWILCFIACAAYFFPCGLSGHFDRYMTFYMPFVMILALDPANRISPKELRRLLPVSVLLMLLIGYYSVAGTHDYLSWNRTRWNVLQNLMSVKGVSPLQIDGGIEFNAWYTYHAYPEPIRVPFDVNYRKSLHKMWYWVYDDEYLLSFKPLEGYQPLQAFSYSRWLPPFKSPPLLLLHRKGEKI